MRQAATRVILRRIRTTLTLLALCAAVSPFAFAAAVSEPLPSLQGDAAREHLERKGLHGSLGEAFEAARYGVWPQADAISADNPQQRYRTSFAPDGIRVVTREQHELQLQLDGWGYGSRLVRSPAGELTHLRDRVEIVHRGNASTGESETTLTEWYVNRRAGLEQGFVVHAPPGVRHAGERLRVVLRVAGTLRAELAVDGDAVLLRDEVGTVSMRYGGLVAWDRDGRTLPARLVVAATDEIALELDDRLAAFPVTIDPVITNELVKLTASDAAALDQFGFSVAISGDTAIVGAFFNGDAGSASGSAYVFGRDEGGADAWGELAKLTASDTAAGDQFGFSVAISGDTAIVGAYFNDDDGNNSGSAYVFGRDEGGADSWGELTKLTASDAATGDLFGFSVAISGDTTIVGAHFDDDGGNSSGSAYVFGRDEGGADAWGELAKLTASDAAAGDLFGFSVAISGEAAIVGAYFDDDDGSASGSAYVFGRDEGGADDWGELAKLTASDAAAGDRFGWTVAISGDTAIVGAYLDDDGGTDSGSAYIFGRDEGGADAWGELAKLTASDAAAGDTFGFSVAISGDTAIVGANLDDDDGTDSGSAFVFGRDEDGADAWGELATLTASDAAVGDRFGFSVAISGDTAIVGANLDDDAGSFSGSAYIFHLADSDGDGVPDDLDVCPGQDDTVVGGDDDGDGIPDCLDGLVFSTATTHYVFGSGNVFRDGINEIAPLSSSIDVLASFLPWNSNLDAVDRRADGELLFSVTPTTVVSVGGVSQTLRHDVVYSFADGLVSEVLDPTDFGLSLQTLDAIDALDDGSYALSVSQSRWVFHAGGSDYLRPAQVWRLIPLGPGSATLELLADFGPMRVRDVNGVDVLPDGRIAITSAHRDFVALPGLFSIWPQSVYIWDGATLSLAFDGQAARLRDMDAISLVDAEAPADPD